LTYAFLGIEYKHFLSCDTGLNEGFITTENALVWLVEHLAEAEVPYCNIDLMNTNTKPGLAGASSADIARNQKRNNERTQASSINGGAGAGAGGGGDGSVVQSGVADEISELMRRCGIGEPTRAELLRELEARVWIWAKGNKFLNLAFCANRLELPPRCTSV
jgi:hypothetical protein